MEAAKGELNYRDNYIEKLLGELEAVRVSANKLAKEIIAERDRYKEALKDIEMAPRILHKDNLVDNMQNLANQALSKGGVI